MLPVIVFGVTQTEKLYSFTMILFSLAILLWGLFFFTVTRDKIGSFLSFKTGINYVEEGFTDHVDDELKKVIFITTYCFGRAFVGT